MEKKRNTPMHRTLIEIIIILLLLLWIPVAYEKIIKFAEFKDGVFRQPIPLWLKNPVAHLVPVAEATTVVLLIFRRTRLWGLYCSLVLMIIFTCFIGLALVGVYKNALCHCGAVITGMSWPMHFFFNFFFLTLSAYGIYLTKNNKVQIPSGDLHQGLVGQKTV